MTTPENNDGIIKTSISFDHSKYEEQKRKEMATMKPATVIEVTKRLILCPCCGESTGSSSDHLAMGVHWGPWYCDNCGQAFHGVNKPEGVAVDRLGKRIVETLVLLKLRQNTEKPIHIVVDGRMYVNDDDDLHTAISLKQSQDKYHYEEHTCPSNYLAVNISENGDPDPHGVFEHVQTIIKPQADKNNRITTSGGFVFPDNYLAWMDLFPILQ